MCKNIPLRFTAFLFKVFKNANVKSLLKNQIDSTSSLARARLKWGDKEKLLTEPSEISTFFLSFSQLVLGNKRLTALKSKMMASPDTASSVLMDAVIFAATAISCYLEAAHWNFFRLQLSIEDHKSAIVTSWMPKWEQRKTHCYVHQNSFIQDSIRN